MTEYSAEQIAKLQESAKRHMWLHFTRMSSYNDADIPVIVRGSGEYVFDQYGKRYLDGLAGLFVSQVRGVPSVRSTETLVYLKLRKQTYTWGTR